MFVLRLAYSVYCPRFFLFPVMWDKSRLEPTIMWTSNEKLKLHSNTFNSRREVLCLDTKSIILADSAPPLRRRASQASPDPHVIY